MDAIDGSGLWSVTTGVAPPPPPPPPVTVTIGGGIIKDRIEEKFPKRETEIPADIMANIRKRIQENELIEIFFISDDDV